MYQGAQSAYNTAHISDSLYYTDSIEIKLDLINYSGESAAILHFTPHQSSKETGIFNNEPYIVYRINDSLPFFKGDQNSLFQNPLNIEIIKLSISIPNKQIISEGSINLISNPTITNPDGYLKKLEVYQEENLSISWTRTRDVKYQQIGMRFIYDELADGQLLTKDAMWVTDISVNGSIELYPEKFFRKICTVIKEDPKISARYLREIQIEVFTADENYKFYKLRQEIGWNERLGEELNMKNAIGLFSCIGRANRYGLTLSLKSMDSLAYGQYTKHLKFRPW